MAQLCTARTYNKRGSFCCQRQQLYTRSRWIPDVRPPTRVALPLHPRPRVTEDTRQRVPPEKRIGARAGVGGRTGISSPRIGRGWTPGRWTGVRDGRIGWITCGCSHSHVMTAGVGFRCTLADGRLPTLVSWPGLGWWMLDMMTSRDVTSESAARSLDYLATDETQLDSCCVTTTDWLTSSLLTRTRR